MYPARVDRHDIKQFGFEAGVEEDEAGMIATVARIHALMEGEIKAGLKPQRVIVMGFSQGGAMSLLAAITSLWEIGGAASISGWVPLKQKVMRVSMFHGDHILIN